MAVVHRLKHWLDSRSADRTVKVLVIVSLLLASWATISQWQLVRCQAAYAQASNKSQAARAIAATEDREALDHLVSSVVKDPRAGLGALRTYELVRAQADERRRSNPVPPPPSTTCG